MKHWLPLLFLLAATLTAPAATPLTAGQTAVNFYLLCRETPLNLTAINAMRSTRAVQADRQLSSSTLAARAGVLSAIGSNLATVQILSENTLDDQSTVAVVLSYYQKKPARRLEVNLVREQGVWKVAN